MPANKEFTPGIFLFTPWDPHSVLINSWEVDAQKGKILQSLSIVRDGKVVNKFLDLGELMDGVTGGPFRLQSISGAIDFFPPFSSDIYRINQMGCHVAYRIAFDEPTIKPGTPFTSSMHPEIFNQTIFESDTYLLIECMIRNKVYLTFFNKKTHQVTTCQNPWNDKMDAGYLFQIIGMVDNKLVLSATNMDIREVVSKLDPTGTRLIDKTILDKIDPESQLANPILVLVELN